MAILTERSQAPFGNLWGQARSHLPHPLLTVLALGLIGSLGGCSEISQELSQKSYEAQLASYLTANDAKVYGAYWCPHCAAQKERFGAAAEQIPYVECDPEGANAQPGLCQQKAIRAYPTWEIGGAFYEGNLPLGRLAELSGFDPPPE
ncbi:hypothetical protein IQ241_21045 [Romeria aff. gracilis LEGE 07310]|uniref:Thioredoxin domain-containing protein n=1 Tax=Vasconcelosia minhoensis LEGE 07310 TaxID=915328 RepID=A0A8J7DEF1_9CYAN|nr:hypothetical protein [Romeria gracilis]MBE9079748.1 hypothetical protein [Romeria aff. gracilis LEGE 07310]